MSIGSNIRKIREKMVIEKPMNRHDLAKKAGINEVTLWHVERGQVNTSIITLMKIADALGVTLDQLVRENGED